MVFGCLQGSSWIKGLEANMIATAELLSRLCGIPGCAAGLVEDQENQLVQPKSQEMAQGRGGDMFTFFKPCLKHVVSQTWMSFED